MKRVLKTIGLTLLWTAIAALFVHLAVYAGRERSQIEVGKVRVTIADSASVGGFVTSHMVHRWIDASDVKYMGLPIDAVNTQKIEESILRHSFVKKAEVYVDLDGTLGVRITQRRPVARVCCSGGYEFYLSDDCHILPVQGTQAVYIPIITGSASFPFSASEYGDYERIIRKHKDDFVKRYTELSAKRDEYAAAITDRKAERREIQARRPMLMRLWGKSKREEFRKKRDNEIAALDAEIEKYERDMALADEKMKAEVEKQKKSEKTYEFLPKLLTFVKNLAEDDFWNAQIVQINLLAGRGGRQPEVELIPRAGAHVIRLGHLENVEEKLDKLLGLYRHVLDYEGWNSVRYIDLRFENQIVCTK